MKESLSYPEYAFSVYQGIVREVYKINQWLPSGTLEYTYRDRQELTHSDRWEFEGEIARDTRDQYVRKSVRVYLGKSNKNPIKYENA